jgi:hypothetical protein
MPETKGPVGDLLHPLGLAVEPREVGPIAQIVASGVGSLIGSVVAAAAGYGMVGRAVASIGGAVLGHVVVTNRIVREPRVERVEGPASPVAVSDRR